MREQMTPSARAAALQRASRAEFMICVLDRTPSELTECVRLMRGATDNDKRVRDAVHQFEEHPDARYLVMSFNMTGRRRRPCYDILVSVPEGMNDSEALTDGINALVNLGGGPAPQMGCLVFGSSQTRALVTGILTERGSVTLPDGRIVVASGGRQ